jgi:hypothetical protein
MLSGTIMPGKTKRFLMEWSRRAIAMCALMRSFSVTVSCIVFAIQSTAFLGFFGLLSLAE